MIRFTTVGYLGHTFKRCMEISRNHFYVTLFSSASKEVFPDNTLTAFMIHLAQPIDLGISDWEVGLTELSYKAPNRQLMRGTLVDIISSVNVLVYCDLISPQMVGTESVRLLRTIICPHNWETTCSIISIIYLLKRNSFRTYELN